MLNRIGGRRLESDNISYKSVKEQPNGQSQRPRTLSLFGIKRWHIRESGCEAAMRSKSKTIPV